MRLAITVILWLTAITTALADHNSLHQCNYLMPGYTPNRFTELDNGTLRDERTGLVWQRCPYGQTWDGTVERCVGGAQLRTWGEALNDVQAFNLAELDLSRPIGWRLPNIKELASLVNRSCVYPASYRQYFPSLGAIEGEAATVIWSATPDITGTHKATVSDGAGGTIEADVNHIWCINFQTGTDQRCPMLGVDNKRHVYFVRTPTEGAP